MNSRAQVTLPVIAGILAIIILFLFIIILSSNVDLSIKLNREDVPKGLDITLNYEVTNGNWFSDVYGIELEWVILNENNYLQKNDTVTIRKLIRLDKHNDNIIIDTLDLSRGQYTLLVHLDYWVSGKWETKHLSLQFEVI